MHELNEAMYESKLVYYTPTFDDKVRILMDAVPGDLSLVLPFRLMKDIDEMIIALDNVTPDLVSDETLLYGVEVKFYYNKVKIDESFQTNIKNLYVGGDGAGITRGLMQASVNGVLLVRKV